MDRIFPLVKSCTYILFHIVVRMFYMCRNQYAVTIAAMEEKLLTLMKKSQLLEKKNESL